VHDTKKLEHHFNTVRRGYTDSVWRLSSSGGSKDDRKQIQSHAHITADSLACMANVPSF